jgi:hypothetical protein
VKKQLAEQMRKKTVIFPMELFLQNNLLFKKQAIWGEVGEDLIL